MTLIKRALFASSIFMALIALTTSLNATILFFEDFNNPGDLDGTTPDISGTAWDVTLGSYTVGGDGVLDTFDSNTGLDNIAFSEFTRPLSSGEELMLSIEWVESNGNFSSSYAGIAIWEADNYLIWLGIPNGQGEWGVDFPVGNHISFSSSITSETQSALFSYDSDTGDWGFSMSGQTISGNLGSGLAISRLSIQTPRNNFADFAVNSLTATVIPEPSTYASAFGVIVLCATVFLRRRRL